MLATDRFLTIGLYWCILIKPSSDRILSESGCWWSMETFGQVTLNTMEVMKVMERRQIE